MRRYNGMIQEFFWRPPSMVSPRQRRSFDSYLSGPLSKSQGFPLMSYKHRASSISALFAAGGPSAILGRIITIAIDAIERFTVRPVTHICKEILEQLPSFANLNAPTPVIRVTNTTGGPAPGKHSAPDTMYLGVSHSMGYLSPRTLFGRYCHSTMITHQ